MEKNGEFHAPAAGTHWIRGWVGGTAGLDILEKREMSYSCRDSNPVPSSP